MTRSSRRLEPRAFPFAYYTLLRQRETPAQQAARERLSPYRRPSLRHAFNAGWFAYGVISWDDLGAAFEHCSTLGLAAVRRGWASHNQWASRPEGAPDGSQATT